MKTVLKRTKKSQIENSKTKSPIQRLQSILSPTQIKEMRKYLRTI